MRRSMRVLRVMGGVDRKQRVIWGDSSSGGCEVVETIVGSPVRMRLDCGTGTFTMGSTLTYRLWRVTVGLRPIFTARSR